MDKWDTSSKARFLWFLVTQDRMQSSNHRLRDMEQHHPLLSAGADVESSSLATGVIVESTHMGQAAGNRTLWFIHDSCGMVCATMTWLLVLYAEFVVNFVMLPSKNFWYSLLNGAAFNFLAVLALASHVRTMLTDPVRMSWRVKLAESNNNNLKWKTLSQLTQLSFYNCKQRWVRCQTPSGVSDSCKPSQTHLFLLGSK